MDVLGCMQQEAEWGFSAERRLRCTIEETFFCALEKIGMQASVRARPLGKYIQSPIEATAEDQPSKVRLKCAPIGPAVRLKSA